MPVLELKSEIGPRYKNPSEGFIGTTPDLIKQSVSSDQLNYLQRKSSNPGAFSLHNASHEDYRDKLRTLIKDPLLNTVLPDISSMFSVVGNLAASLAHFGNFPEKAKYYADLLGAFGTKLFLFVNATINTIEQLSRNNYLSAFGYFLDNIIAAVIPQEHTFLARGLSSGTYHLSYSLGLANGNKAKFVDFDDHNSHIIKALKKTFQNLFSKDLLNNVFKSDNAISGVLGGIFSIFGVIVWPFLGKKTATFLRDLGGSLKSANYINPGHIYEGRRLYFLSGVLQVAAALSDFCSSMFSKTRSYMVPVSLGFDGLAKYILRQSVNKGELGEI